MKKPPFVKRPWNHRLASRAYTSILSICMSLGPSPSYIYLTIRSEGVRTCVSESDVSETATQIALSHQWNGENQLLSPQDIIRLYALDRLETILIIVIKAELVCLELSNV
jgi:hypothetical protein